MDKQQLEKNKAIIRRFDKECVEKINDKLLDQLVLDKVVNHLAPEGSNGKESFRHYINEVLHIGLSEIQVEIHQQIAEADIVVSRKTISGVHTGNLLGIPATNKKIEINLIEIIRLENEQYAEHWAESNLKELLITLSKK